ncbi:unnamed protein product [Penicillium roqueforti FM164]|uniref:Uncharacterized protein n=1 Tax=Penicillium roqueforti (strain FM164) TaxID=1365484 RepID=W6QMI2_PENRF|nr:unnamed protein product [Penicillium roqueforti FM164]
MISCLRRYAIGINKKRLAMDTPFINLYMLHTWNRIIKATSSLPFIS